MFFLKYIYAEHVVVIFVTFNGTSQAIAFWNADCSAAGLWSVSSVWIPKVCQEGRYYLKKNRVGGR
jgi:hypothetical protein